MDIFYYSDVLGRLKAIQPLEQVLVRGQTLESKREFILENMRFANKLYKKISCIVFLTSFVDVY